MHRRRGSGGWPCSHTRRVCRPGRARRGWRGRSGWDLPLLAVRAPSASVPIAPSRSADAPPRLQAARYPERVQHLLLVSPVGVGARPPEWEPAQRFTQSWTPRALLFRTAIKCWDHNLTPGRVIRGLGPWGPGLVARYARGRFQQGLALTEEETARFERYFYHILAARGSGEFALRHILEPFAWPRSALEHRAADLPVPVTFFYGDQDWMDVRAGKRMAAALHARRGRACPSDCKVLVTPKAGHYLFMDNPGACTGRARAGVTAGDPYCCWDRGR